MPIRHTPSMHPVVRAQCGSVTPAPPGAGKTLLARSLPSILPNLTLEEALEVTRIYSVSDLLPGGSPLIRHRPFRSPHHTISHAGLVGGGRIPHPGEISLAHRGVLFLDELPEFDARSLEVMRQPLDNRFPEVCLLACGPGHIGTVIAVPQVVFCGYSTMIAVLTSETQQARFNIPS